MTLFHAALNLYLEEHHPGWTIFYHSSCPNEYIIRNLEHLFLYLFVDNRQKRVVVRSRNKGDLSEKSYNQFTVLDCISEEIQAMEIIVSEAKNLHAASKGD